MKKQVTEFCATQNPLQFLDFRDRNWAVIKHRKPHIYQLKIVLERSKPQIYRRILIPADVTLEKLHLTIQGCFNWWNYHLYQYINMGKSRTIEAVFNDSRVDMLHAINTLMGKKVPEYKSINYEYDFGDCWQHKIILEKIYEFTDKDKHTVFPVCIEANELAPFEDSGNVFGWADKLAIAQDKKHEDHKEVIAWLEEMWNINGEYRMGGKFSVKGLLAKKPTLLPINKILGEIQLYKRTVYKDLGIPISIKELLVKEKGES